MMYVFNMQNTSPLNYKVNSKPNIVAIKIDIKYWDESLMDLPSTNLEGLGEWCAKLNGKPCIFFFFN